MEVVHPRCAGIDVSKKDDIARPTVPLALTERFQRRIDQARKLADEQLKRADTADATRDRRSSNRPRTHRS